MDRRIDAHTSVADFVRTAAPPVWLERAWAGADRRGIDKLSQVEIEAEIEAERQSRTTAAGHGAT